MRALLGLAAVVLLLAVCGWITFSWNGNRASVNVETEKIESDTERIVDEGQELLEEAGDEVPTRDEVVVPATEEGEPASQPPLTEESAELERRE
jgi:hypothetical protein